jgi:hypothetical protein
MSIKSLSLFAALGLAGFSLSGCVYDGGPYAYEGPGYYGSGYYAGGAVIYDRGGYYGPRYHRYRPVYGDYYRPRPSTPRPRPVSPPQFEEGPAPIVRPEVADRRPIGDRRSQYDQIFLPPVGEPGND